MHDFTATIESLGDRNLEVARLEAEQKEKDRKEKEKDREHQANVAQLEANQREKDRKHQIRMHLRAGIDNLKSERRKLVISLAEHSNKRNKAMVEVFEDQIAEIKTEYKAKEEEICSLLD